MPSSDAPTLGARPRHHLRRRLLAFVVAAVIGSVLGVVAPPSGPAGAVETYGGYVALASPQRIVDTRQSSPVVAGANRTVAVPTIGGIPSRSQIGALVLNVTVTAPSAATHVTVWGSGAEPATSTLNVVAVETRANSATVVPGTGPAGVASLLVANNSGTAHVVIDVVGYFGPNPGVGDLFVPTTPFRLADSRSGLGFANELHAGETRVLTVSTPGSVVPAAATAVAVNLTAVGGSEATHLKAHGAGIAAPGASTLNAPAGAVVPNLAIVRVTKNLAGQGRIAITNAKGDVDVLVDVVGWFAPAAPGGLYFFPRPPERIKDSRDTTPLPPTGIASSHGLDRGQVMLANLTGIAASADTHLTAYPAVGPIPPTSTLNLVKGQTSANAAIIGLEQGFYKVRNQAGITHFIVDVSGFFDGVPT